MEHEHYHLSQLFGGNGKKTKTGEDDGCRGKVQLIEECKREKELQRLLLQQKSKHRNGMSKTRGKVLMAFEKVFLGCNFIDLSNCRVGVIV